MATFSSSVLRRFGAGVTVTSMICPPMGKVPPVRQCRIKAGEELVDRLGLHQALPEQPHCRRIGHYAIEPHAQETLEQEPILDLELGRLVRQ